MFTEPKAKKEANKGDTGKTTAAQGQFPASQGAEGKAPGMRHVSIYDKCRVVFPNGLDNRNDEMHFKKYTIF